MKLMAFSIHDQKARLFSHPFFQPTYESAERLFANAVNDETTMFCLHSGDYSLFYIGDFDDETGELVGRPIKLLCPGSELKAKVARIATLIEEK